eukprot:281736_1
MSSFFGSIGDLTMQLNGDNVQIELMCRYDTVLSTYKTIISLSCNSMRYIWYMPADASIKDLLAKIGKIYCINIESIKELNDLSTKITDLQHTINDTLNSQHINELTVHLNDNNNYIQFNHSNNNNFSVQSIISKHSNKDMLKKQLLIFLDNIYCPIYCPLQCILKYNNNNN